MTLLTIPISVSITGFSPAIDGFGGRGGFGDRGGRGSGPRRLRWGPEASAGAGVAAEEEASGAVDVEGRKE